MNIDHKQSKGANSQLTVHAEEHSNSRVTLEILLRCSNLTNNDVFSKSVRLFHLFAISQAFFWVATHK